MASSVTITGLPELHTALQGLKADLKELTPVNRQAAAELVRAIAGTAPRLTGRLASSFEVKATATTAEAVSSLVYAPVINDGWAGHNIAAQHYLEEALKVATPAVESTYQSGVAAMCRKAEA